MPALLGSILYNAYRSEGKFQSQLGWLYNGLRRACRFVGSNNCSIAHSNVRAFAWFKPSFVRRAV
jgi:hypothetical protein